MRITWPLFCASKAIWILANSCPYRLAAVQALQLPTDWYTALNSTYRQRQQVAFALLDALHCTFDRNQQGLFVWAKIPDQYADGYALSDELLYEKNIFLTPGGIFGSHGDRYVRISLCSPAENLQRGLDRLTPISADLSPALKIVHSS